MCFTPSPLPHGDDVNMEYNQWPFYDTRLDNLIGYEMEIVSPSLYSYALNKANHNLFILFGF